MAKDTLDYTTNPFGGVILTPGTLPTNREEFREHLRSSIDEWCSAGFKAVWLELDLKKSVLICESLDLGFRYHHANEDYLMLTLKLVEDSPIPPYASHYVGVGGVVINTKQELLVVQEKIRRSPGRHYKLPGGTLKTSENLVDGVVREVKEETGIDTSFESLVSLRNMHEYRFGCSDIYIVCRLKPLSHEITIQIEEIDECLWMHVEDYYRSNDVSLFNKLIVKAALETRGVVPTEINESQRHKSVEVFLPPGLNMPS